MTGTSSEYALLITAIFTGICSVIAAFKSNKGSNLAVGNKEKLEEIHNLTNGNLSEVKEQRDLALTRNEYLQKLIFKLLDRLPPDTLLKVQSELKARRSDIQRRVDSKDID